MINAETLKREKMLFAYTSALEQGDFARLETILETASGDAILERQIIEINTVFSRPHESAAAQAAPKISFISLWQRIKSTAAGLFSIRIRHWPALRSIALGVGAFMIVLLGVLALLGPAVGKIFTNVVAGLPGSTSPLYPVVATRTVAESSPTDSYWGYGYPAPLSGVQQTVQQTVTSPAPNPASA